MMWRLLLAMGCALALTSGTMAAAVPADPNLMMHWDMNGLSGSTLTDVSGNGNHGTLTNGNGTSPWGLYGFVSSEVPTTTLINGAGNALDLDAIFGYDNPGALAVNKDGGAYAAVDLVLPETGTIAMWYKTNYVYSYQQIWDNSGTSTKRKEDNWECWMDSEAMVGWRASPDSSNGGPDDDYSWSGVKCKYSLPDERGGTSGNYGSTWLHLTATWERTSYEAVTYDNPEYDPLDPESPERLEYNTGGFMNMKFYVDGVLEYETLTGTDPTQPDVAHSWQDPGTTFYLGGGCYHYYEEGDEWRGNTHAIGIWDEVSIWDRQLSEAEIQDLMTYGIEYTKNLGDANGDNVVDELDAKALAEHWKVAGGWSQGDFNEDGMVDERDASILASHWGMNYNEAMAPMTTVPEPSTVALLLGALAVLALRRRK